MCVYGGKGKEIWNKEILNGERQLEEDTLVLRKRMLAVPPVMSLQVNPAMAEPNQPITINSEQNYEAE